MERKTEYDVKENGVFTEKTVTTVTKDDGFVPKNQINPASRYNYGKYQKGYSKSVHYATNDPKVTIPAIIIITGIFQAIVIVLVILGIKNGALENPSLVVMGLFFIAFIIFFTFAEIREIKKIKEKFKNKVDDSNN